ncbi:MAG: hypothetical protein Q7S14_00260 [bacterium]|nr:hypothetical protein [bacterium]
MGLSKAQKQNISLKRIEAQKRGAKAVKQRRLIEIKELMNLGLKDIGAISQRDLLLIGTTIYWAEGAKQKEGVNVSQCVDFSNSDPNMVLIFIKWLKECCNVSENELKFALCIHKSKDLDINNEMKWWKSYLGIDRNLLIKIRYKKDNFGTRRHFMDYHGQFIVKVCKSTKLNRRISGWVYGINRGI